MERGKTPSDWAEPRTSGDHAIDERLFASEEIFAQYLPPIVAVENELVFEEVNISPLVPKRLSRSSREGKSFLLLPIAQVISPVVRGDFPGRILPRLQLSVFFVVDFIEMIGVASYEVGGSEYLGFSG